MQSGEAEIEARGRHARQPVLAAGPVRQRIEFDEIEHLRDRDGDHREIDASAPQRDQPDQIADDAGCDHADDQRQKDIRKACARQQVGGDEAAGAIKRRLAEGQKAGETEQNIEADAEQAPHQNAVDRVGRKAEVRQHERRNNQPDRSQRLDQKRTLLEHQIDALIRGPWCRAGPAGAASERASSPRTASRRHSRD